MNILKTRLAPSKEGKMYAIANPDDPRKEISVIEQVVLQGDLSKLDPEQRVIYYRKVCESAGLNPFTRPFEYILLNGKLTLYAKKDATEQLRKINGISITSVKSNLLDDIYVVTAQAKTKDGRTDEAIGAVTIGHLKGDAKANAIMKAETKAKRRVTLSISGMGFCDETEIETIPSAKKANVDIDTGELKICALITSEQAQELNRILSSCDIKFKEWFFECIKTQFNADSVVQIPAEKFEKIKIALVNNAQKNATQQDAKESA